MIICGLMVPFAHAQPIEVNSPTTVNKVQKSVDLTNSLKELNKDNVRVTVAGVKGLDGIATVGNYDGDMVSHLTTAVTLSFVAHESDGNSMVSAWKDGERMYKTMTLATATEKAITNAIPAEYSLAQSSTPEGMKKVLGEFGELTPSTELMANMLTASYRAVNSKGNAPSNSDIFRGVISGFMDGVEEDDIVVALKDAPTGIQPYVIDHKAHRTGKVDDDDEERKGNGHTMVSGYIMSNKVTFAVAMVVPDDQVDTMKKSLVDSLLPHMGVEKQGEESPKDEAPKSEEKSPEPEVNGAPGYRVDEGKSAFQ